MQFVLFLFSCWVMSNSLWLQDCSTPGFSVIHRHPEFAQIHVHWVGHVIQPSHPLSSYLIFSSFPCLQSFSIRAFSNEPALCTRWPNIWASASASVLPMSIQDWFPLELAGLISLQSKGLSKVFFSPTIRKYQFFSSQPSLGPSSHLYMTTGKTVALTIWTSAKWCLCFLNHCLGLSQLSPQGASVF